MAAAVPSMTRDTTMKLTAEEGIRYLKNEGENTLLKMQGLLSERLPRDGTMVETAKEAKGILVGMGGAPDEDAQTRGQAKKIEELSTPSPTKKSKVKRDGTMVATTKDGEEFLARANKPRKFAGKRQSTIAQCIAEAGTTVNVNEGRKTRNASKSPTKASATATKRKTTPQNKAPAKSRKPENESNNEELKKETKIEEASS